MTRKAATRTTNEIESELRDCGCVMCRKAAKEIRRLTKVIDDYVYIAAASAREIKQLRQSHEKSNEKRCDSDTGGATLTDAEREAVEYFSQWCIGPSKRLERYAATLRGLLERTRRISGGEDETMTDEKNTAEPSGASGGSQRVALERLLKMARREHYYCEDSWYSCPLAEDGCANDSYAKDECSCGASDHNAKVDEIAATLRPLLERLS